MRESGFSRRDWLAAAALWAVTFAVFGWSAGRLGYYYDDATWLCSLPSTDLGGLVSVAAGYMPGRPLHVIWHGILYRIAGDPVRNLAALHALHSGLDALVTAGFFLLLRILSLPTPAAVIAAGLFSFWPIHGETHYWLEAGPMNLVSTLFVLTFAATSAALAGGRSDRLLWIVDLAAFVCAMYTYDQVFFVLVGIAALRVGAAWLGRSSGWRLFLLLHLPLLAAAAWWLRLKLNVVPGAAPFLQPGVWPRLADNVVRTLKVEWWPYEESVFHRAQAADWLLAAVAAGVVTALTLWLARRAPATERLPAGKWLIAIAPAFFVAAYLPAWLWHLAPRHHYLPSLGLFALLAVVLPGPRRNLVADLLPGLLLYLSLGGAVFLFAAASRGEARYWEDAFAAKKQLFDGLRPQLEGNRILVLEGFPENLGPAYLIRPQDAQHGPSLLLRDKFRTPAGFTGSLSGVPAPSGIFLHTHGLYGAAGFRYRPTREALDVHFRGWSGGRLLYETNPLERLPYQVVSSRCAPAKGLFHVEHVSARRDGADTLLSLDVETPGTPGTYHSLVASFFERGEFHRWSERFEGRIMGVLPVLWAEPDVTGHGGACRWEQTLRLHSFPATDRIRLEFYQASEGRAPVRLGESETAVTP